MTLLGLSVVLWLAACYVVALTRPPLLRLVRYAQAEIAVHRLRYELYFLHQISEKKNQPPPTERGGWFFSDWWTDD
jgi:hypothetical protein